MRKIFVNEYSPSNPKIDLYVNGHYQYSTNFFLVDARMQKTISQKIFLVFLIKMVRL